MSGIIDNTQSLIDKVVIAQSQFTSVKWNQFPGHINATSQKLIKNATKNIIANNNIVLLVTLFVTFVFEFQIAVTIQKNNIGTIIIFNRLI